MDIRNCHYTFSHYDEFCEKRYKAKIAYETEQEAIAAARRENLNPKNIHKLSAYKCNICQKWHIGRNSRKELTDEEREKIRKKINFEKTLYRYSEKR